MLRLPLPSCNPAGLPTLSSGALLEPTDSYPWASVLSKVGALYLKAFAGSPGATYLSIHGA